MDKCLNLYENAGKAKTRDKKCEKQTVMIFNKKSLFLSVLLLFQLAIKSLHAEDTLVLNDGRTLKGSISFMDEDTIVFYDSQADSQLRIPKTSVVGGRFGQSLPNNQIAPDNIVKNGRPPLVHLPFDKSFENLGSEILEIASNGIIPFSDDPRNEPQKSVLSTGSGSYVRIRTTPILNTLQQFSLSFWFRSFDTNRPQYLVSKWKAAYTNTQTADGMFTIAYTNAGNSSDGGGRLFIFLVDQNSGYHPYLVDNAIPNNLIWNHVVVSFGNQQLNAYVNGSLVFTTDINYELYQKNVSDLLLMTALYRNTDKNGKIQEDHNTFNLIGQMDDFRLWDRVITTEDVRNLYRNSYTATVPTTTAADSTIPPVLPE